MTAIYKLGKIGSAQSNMPDVTTMTQGEFNRFLEAQRFQIMAEDAASGERAMLQDIADAIDTGDLSRVPASLQDRVRSFMERSTRMNGPAFPMNFNGTQKKPANTSSGVGSIALTLLQPFINWLFNFALPVAAPFFLYIFLDNTKAIGLVVIKKAKQIAILQTISNLTGTPYGNLKAAIRSSLIAKLGMEPTQLLNDYINAYVPATTVNVTAQDTQDKWDKMHPSGQNTGGKIGAVPAVVGIIIALLPLVIKAIPVVLDIAAKLISMLGKNEPGLTDAEKNAPDPEFDFAATIQSVSNLFSGGNKNDTANDAAAANDDTASNNTSSNGKPANQGTSTTTIAAGAAALVGLYLLFK